MNIRPIDAGFFKDLTAFEHAGDTAAAAWPVPCISLERTLAIDGFEAGADVELQLGEVLGS